MHITGAAIWRAVWLGVVMAGLLAGCNAPPNPSAKGFRDTGVAISSSTRFDPDRFAGDWRVVARFATVGDVAGAKPETFMLRHRSGGFDARHVYARCNSSECVQIDETKPAPITGPGRYQMPIGTGTQNHWVLWVDDDYRMAAIGTPGGEFGWIMAKGGAGARGDLRRAAQEIMEWQGYDMTRLVEITE